MPYFGEEGTHAGEFIVDEETGAGQRSRETIVIESGEKLVAGAVIAKLSTTGNYVEYDNGGADGAEIAFGVLFDAVDATGGDTDGVGLVRDCAVTGDELVWITGAVQGDIDAGTADLLKKGIILR
jgi:hypothetical protein